MKTIAPFNPLDHKSLGRSVAQAMLEQKVASIDNIEGFRGAGIYALYYSGDFPPYSLISKANMDEKFEKPIYVGKAVHPGTRKGVSERGEVVSPALFKRLNEHTKSIEEVNNLSPRHFHCRFLVVEDIWIPLGESLLIAKHAPIWNNLVDGFGNHDPGKGRYNQMVSRWDVLHSGRDWAKKCKKRNETMKQISNDVIQRLSDGQ